MRHLDKEQCFTESEILRLFNARGKDLGLAYFEVQFNRFRDYCQKQCINRKVRLVDLEMGYHAAVELSHIISVNNRIAHLDLKKNTIGDDGAIALMKSIKRNKSIVHLDLTSNEITYVGGKKLFKYLLANESLISLKLGSVDGVHKNRVGYKGIGTCATLLEYSQFLSYLDLRSNVLCDNGIEVLCGGLSHNRLLTQLNLSNNEITSYGMEKLKDALKSTKIVELDLSFNPLGNAGIEFICSYLQSRDCILFKLNLTECKFQGLGCMNLMIAVKRC